MIVPVLVHEVMESDVATVTREDSALTAVRTLYGRDVGSVVVVEDGRAVGILTDSDVLGLVVGDAPLSSLTVGEVMSEGVVTVSASASIEAAARKLREYGYDQLAVVEEGRLVGVISVRHLSYYLPQISLRDVDAEAEDRDWDYEYRDEGESGVGVGDVVTFRKSLSDRDVRRFAEASGDTNPLHLDDAYARETRFGGRIVHGALSSSVISAALTRLPGLVVYLSQSVRYVAPVRVGDSVRAVCEVVDAMGHDRYRLRTTVYAADDSTVVDGEATVLVDHPPVAEEAGTVADAETA
ncbi:MAG: CBS domain-containing protein [Haloplanus sp.]